MHFIFSTPVLIRHLWQLKTAVFLRRCLICTVPLSSGAIDTTLCNFGMGQVSQSVCLWKILPVQSNVVMKKMKYLMNKPNKLFELMHGNQTQLPGSLYTTIHFLCNNGPNKLECLSLANLSSLEQCSNLADLAINKL